MGAAGRKIVSTLVHFALVEGDTGAAGHSLSGHVMASL
jgi:hypothetical protein